MAGEDDQNYKPAWSFAQLHAERASRNATRSQRGGRSSSPTPSIAPSHITSVSRSTRRTSQGPAAQTSSSGQNSKQKDADIASVKGANRHRPSATENGPRECAVCAEEVPNSGFPAAAATSKCEHAPNTCSDCLAQSIRSDMDTKFWNSISCPECGNALSQDDVERHADGETTERYRSLKRNAETQASPTFRWCTAGCGTGQDHDGGSDRPMIVCRKCKAKSCFTHGGKWHEGFTCQQWDEVTDPDNESVAPDRRSTVGTETTSRRPAPVAASMTWTRRDISSGISVASMRGALPVVGANTSSRRPPRLTSSTASVGSQARGSGGPSSQISGRRLTLLQVEEEAANIRFSLELARRLQDEEDEKTAKLYEAHSLKIAQEMAAEFAAEEEASQQERSLDVARRLQEEWAARDQEDMDKSSADMARRLQEEWAARDREEMENSSADMARRLQEEWSAIDQEEMNQSSAEVARRLHQKEQDNARLEDEEH